MNISRTFAAVLGLQVLMLSNAHAYGEKGRPHELLLAANQGDEDLSIVNLLDGSEIGRISEGAVTGHEIAVSKSGRLAFVPIYGNSTPGKPGTDGDQIAVIDIARRKVVRHVFFDHGVRPHCIIRNPKDGLLYVTTELDQTVTIIDPETFSIVGSIATGRAQSHMLALSHDGRFAYTANIDSGTISVLDLVSRKLIHIISVADEIQRISISADDSMVFTADQRSSRLAVVDVQRLKVKKWIDLPSTGYGSVSTLDGRFLLVTLPSVSQVAVIDLSKHHVVKSVSTPAGPHEVLIDRSGTVAYVACTEASQVARIDLSQWAVTKIFKVGKTSDGIALVQVPAGL